MFARPAAIAALALLLPADFARAADVFPPPIPRGSEITILRADQTRTKATYLGEGSTPDHLLLEKPRVRNWGGVDRYELARDEVSAIEGRPSPGYEPKLWAASLLVGMLAGGVVGALQDPGQDGVIVFEGVYPGTGFPERSRWPNIAHGMAAGAAVGCLVGLLLAPTRGPVQRWSYESVSPEAPFAPADTSQVPIR